MELFEAITTRSSAGRLTEPGPTPEHLARILEAGGHAPDHGRLKPWRFIVLDDDGRSRFAEAAALGRMARLPTPTPEQLAAEREKIWRSPRVIVVGCRVQRDNAKIPEVEQVLAAGAAVQNMFLAAHALGYGVMWKTGPAAYEGAVKVAVGLEPDDLIVAILHLGTRLK